MHFRFNIAFVSAVFCAILIYTGIVQSPSLKIKSLLQEKDITRIDAIVSSSPAKTSSFDGSYKIIVKPICVYSKTAKSSSKGNAILYVPSEIVESLFPGKVYTSAKKSAGIIIESGARLSFEISKKIYFKDNRNSTYLVSSVSLLDSKTYKNKLSQYRAILRVRFRRLMYSWGKAGGLLLALISGSKEYTEDSLSKSFRLSGISHILALSGMHLALFGGIADFFGGKLFRKAIADFFRIIFISLFVFFAGLFPSLTRALLCALFIFFCALIRTRTPDALSTLSVAFLLQIRLFPNHITEVSFILSYTALLGIILLSQIFKSLFNLSLIGRLTPSKISDSLTTSCAAISFTSPVSLYFFRTFAPIGVISTTLISPLVTIFIYIGLIGIVLCVLLPFLSSCFNDIMNFIYFLIFKLAEYFSHFPSISIY